MPELETDSKLIQGYRYGFETVLEQDVFPKGLNEDIVRAISAKKGEPAWMTEWRLRAYRHWLKMKEPTWARVDYPKIDFQDIRYYAAPKKAGEGGGEVDPELVKTFEKLGMPVLRARPPGRRRGGCRVR
jgi:Fe-S cluster assembly protein SufB